MVLTEPISNENGGGTPRCGTGCGYVHSATGSNSLGFLFTIFYESVEVVRACARTEDICCIIGVPPGYFEERATINSLGSYLASTYLYGVSFICKITSLVSVASYEFGLQNLKQIVFWRNALYSCVIPR